MQTEIRIVHHEEADVDFAEQVSLLASQLRGEPVIVTAEWLRELLAFPKTWMIVACTNGQVVGMLTLSAFPRVRGWTAWIEGVVVEEALRGQGIGRALVQKAVAVAEEQGFDVVNLSSRPRREAANVLYESLGFDLVQTNYRRKQVG